PNMPRFQNIDSLFRQLFDSKFQEFSNGDGVQFLGFASRFLGPPTLPPPNTAAVPVPDGSSLHYFLKIDGIAGDSTDETYKGAFAVDGFSIWLDRHSESSGFGRRRRTGDVLAADGGHLLARRAGAAAC